MGRKIVVLTGAGISAESGLKTFRDAGGLWEGHDIMEVATPEAFARNPLLVLDFYNQRRRQLLTVLPNKAHMALTELEKYFDVTIVTQNVDDLHERAGSSRVIHLHGELLKVRCTVKEESILEWRTDLKMGDLSPDGHQLRPHIVWFGEQVPMIETAKDLMAEADITIIVGTSMQVYPAAGLVDYARPKTPSYYIDPKPSTASLYSGALTVIREMAAVGVPALVSDLIAAR